MEFSSLGFIFRFLPIFLIVFYLVPARGRNLVLFLGSMVFYSLGSWQSGLGLLFFMTVNFFAAWAMDALEGRGEEKTNPASSAAKGEGKANPASSAAKGEGKANPSNSTDPAEKGEGKANPANSTDPAKKEKASPAGPARERMRKYILLMVILLDAGSLCVYKYTSAAMPLGVSFYTFTLLSYIIDVYRKKAPALKNYINYGAYIALFPKLISGPITQYSAMADQLEHHPVKVKRIEHGLSLFIVGLGYKVIIANHLAILWRDIQGIGFESISTPLAWLGAVGYSVQLLFDFQGYSLMAIGIGEMLGFRLPMNFNHPYGSRTVSEFYRRWHMSLGAWFREYIYIPLGGNRKGAGRTIFNLLVVWLVTGMWHGSTINFPLWGLSLFFFIALERLFLRRFMEKHHLVSRIYIWVLLPLTWMVFAITDVSNLAVYFGRLFPFFSTGIAVNPGDFLKYGRIYGIFFLLAFLVSQPLADRLFRKHWKSWWMKAFLFVVLWVCIYQIANGLNNPFMYFSF